MKKIIFKLGIIILFVLVTTVAVTAKPKSTSKTKFYNFDDLLIDGKIKKPQVLYTDARQKVKFERLLRLKNNLLPKLKDTNKDPSLR